MNLMISVCVILALSGCAISSSIQPVKFSHSKFDGAVYSGETTTINAGHPGEEQYRIFHQAASGFVSVQSIRNTCEKRASHFCEQKGKSINTIQEVVSTPPYILGNFPRIELIFECVMLDM